MTRAVDLLEYPGIHSTYGVHGRKERLRLYLAATCCICPRATGFSACRSGKRRREGRWYLEQNQSWGGSSRQLGLTQWHGHWLLLAAPISMTVLREIIRKGQEANTRPLRFPLARGPYEQRPALAFTSAHTHYPRRKYQKLPTQGMVSSTYRLWHYCSNSFCLRGCCSSCVEPHLLLLLLVASSLSTFQVPLLPLLHTPPQPETRNIRGSP